MLGINLHDAIEKLKTTLDPNIVLVGRNVRRDVESLGLQKGEHYSNMLDLLGLYRLGNNPNQTFFIWEHDRLATALLGWPDTENYSATADALKTLRLFQLYSQLQNDIGG